MKLGISGLVVGPIQSNCYIVWDKSTMKGAVVDPGGDLQNIQKAIDDSGCAVEWILLTHGHFDHVYCASEIANLYGAKVAIHEGDVAMMADTLGIADMFYDMDNYSVAVPDKLVGDGDTICIGEMSIRVIHTPGHSLGGVCFDAGEVVFTGDTLFAGSIGRTDFKGGSFDTLISSIQNKLFILDDSTLVLPGHGPESTIGTEKRSNRYAQGVI